VLFDCLEFSTERDELMNVWSLLVGLALALPLSSIAAPAEHAPEHGHGRAVHGGIAVASRDVDFELVPKAQVMTIYVRDHNKPVDTKGATGKITVLAGSERSEAVLSAAGENRLEARGDFKVAKGTKVVAIVHLAGRQPISVRFAVK
jgi:hypothetical protein